MSLFTDDMTIYIGNPKEIKKKILQELISKYRKVVRHKVNIQKSIAFLYTSNDYSVNIFCSKCLQALCIICLLNFLLRSFTHISIGTLVLLLLSGKISLYIKENTFYESYITPRVWRNWHSYILFGELVINRNILKDNLNISFKMFKV